MAVYILNQPPTSALENLTPYESLTGSTPNVDHHRVFGCLAHTLVDSQLRKKFDANS